jgi:aminoglycoside phosphotransferase (APT) family kinase protein
MTAAERLDASSAGDSPPPWMHGLIMEVAGASTRIPDVSARPLAGGVSSDIYRVDTPRLTFCVKRALPKLRVTADWQVPVGRNRFEVDWMRVAGAIDRNAVPAILAEDSEAGAFAMAWLPPERFPVWKARLASGSIDPTDARRVGDLLGRLHRATADRADLAERFATDAMFHAIRLEPYLVATGRVHADLARRLDSLVETTAATRRALVHGDFSPKNLLIGPDGPVVLDAECAWFGDPAFDLAFVLNHLLLKGAWRPQWRERYLECFAALVDAYRPLAAWEAWATLDARTANLLPALMLARVDGKSPVEYLTGEAERGSVRRFARTHLENPARSLAEIAQAWSRHR